MLTCLYFNSLFLKHGTSFGAGYISRVGFNDRDYLLDPLVQIQNLYSLQQA